MYSEGQAKLYYMYMMVDGEVSSPEEKIFHEICQKLNISKSNQENIIAKCKSINSDRNMDCVQLVKRNLEDDYMLSFEDVYIGLYKSDSDSEKAAVLWNLINLGYADRCFSTKEREVVDLLREYWEIKDSLYKEMIDVAETILALEKHKSWLNTNITDFYTRQNKLDDVEKNITNVQETIKTTIAELSL